MPQSKRFMTERGTSYKRSVDIKTDTGDPYNLNDSTVWYTVKSDPELPDEDAELWLYWSETGEDGLSVGNPLTGVVDIAVSPADMAALDAGLYYWYLRVEDAVGAVFTVDAGLLDVLENPLALTPP